MRPLGACCGAYAAVPFCAVASSGQQRLASGHQSLMAGLLHAARPRQWTKNFLVISAPLAAGVVLEPEVMRATAAAFVSFCLTASGVYLVDDVWDAEEDRRHPTKRNRAVATGRVTSRTALSLAALLIALGVGGAFLCTMLLGLTIATYALLMLSYVVWLRRHAVVELGLVTAAYLLRGIAGGAASDIELTQWFLMVMSFGSLFMVAGKRYSELQTLGTDAGTRWSLQFYSESYLRFVWSLAACVTIVAYSLWAFQAPLSDGLRWEAFSIAPFVIAVLRYAVHVDRAAADAPEDVVLRDRALQALGFAWLLLVLPGVLR